MSSEVDQEVALRNFSSAESNSSKGKWIGISIIVALVLAGAIIGILFGLKVIGGSSSSSSDDPTAHNGDLGSTDSSSSSSAEQIGGTSSSSSTGTMISSSAISSSVGDSSSTGTTASSTGGTSTGSNTSPVSTASTSSTATSSTASTSSSTGASTSSSTASASSTGSVSSSTGSTIPAPPSKLTYGTYYNPFKADSPWNSRPLDPVFDGYAIPIGSYPPSVAGGSSSTQVYYAFASDSPMTVIAVQGTSGIANQDVGGSVSNVTIPHWPSATVNVSASADIYDETTGKIHSFTSLLLNTTLKAWTATSYAWSHVNGTGFGDPAHFSQGQRVTGVSSTAGLIRSHEVNDGLPYFRHALAMSIPPSALSRTPLYVYPATSAPYDASYANFGVIPQGSLMMLPPSFNTSTITGAPLRKVAETLKRYGAYVIDRTNTPYALYVENGASFPLTNGSSSSTVQSELHIIRLALRRVLSATQWVDGYDQPRDVVGPGRQNLLSMRGPWVKLSGNSNGDFDSLQQALVFTGVSSPNATKLTQTSKSGLKSFLWSDIKPLLNYTWTVSATGGAQLQLQILVFGKVALTSPILEDKGTWTFTWPNSGTLVLNAWSGIGVATSQVSGQLTCDTVVPYDTSVGKFVPPPQPSPAAATPYPDPVGLPKLTFGTYQTPFTASSPWNSRPLNPVLEAPLIPIDMYFPTVSAGAFSTEIFHATASDPPLTVYPGSRGLADPDLGMAGGAVTIPHWPAATAGASGSDGHADIYDETTGIIHSFWQLVQNTATDVWTATLYSWTHINGTGWGDPAHYYQGPRATGIPSGAGVIRNHEVDDGLPFFRHALTMSLTYSGLSGSAESGGPGYVYPATSADGDLTRNYGHIPEGALLMLPPTFDVSKITGWPLRKVAETLKRFGAYVSDRNDGTPYALYVENGGKGFPLSNATGWDNTVAADLQTIRAGLSRVLSATQWIDGNGAARALLAPGTPNLMSMRGPWSKKSGPGTGGYDTWKQAVVFPLSNPTSTQIIETQGHGLVSISWAKITPNASLVYTVHATGGATLEFQIVLNGKVVNTSTPLGDGKSWYFTWPEGAKYNHLANSGINQTSSVRAELKYTTVQPFNLATGSYYPYP